MPLKSLLFKYLRLMASAFIYGLALYLGGAVIGFGFFFVGEINPWLPGPLLVVILAWAVISGIREGKQNHAQQTPPAA